MQAGAFLGYVAFGWLAVRPIALCAVAVRWCDGAVILADLGPDWLVAHDVCIDRIHDERNAPQLGPIGLFLRGSFAALLASSALGEMALKLMPGGSIRPFCEPLTVTSTPHSSWR